MSMFTDNILEFKRKTNDYDKEEIVAYEMQETIKIDPVKKTVYFKDTYIPFEKVIIAANKIQEGFDDVEDE